MIVMITAMIQDDYWFLVIIDVRDGDAIWTTKVIAMMLLLMMVMIIMLRKMDDDDGDDDDHGGRGGITV